MEIQFLCHSRREATGLKKIVDWKNGRGDVGDLLIVLCQKEKSSWSEAAGKVEAGQAGHSPCLTCTFVTHLCDLCLH